MTPSVSKSRNKRTRAKEKVSAARSARNRPKPIVGWSIGLLMWAIALLTLIGVKPFHSANLTVGQRAQSTVVAATDFECRDLARTEIARQEARDGAPPVFRADSEPYLLLGNELGKLFDRLELMRSTAPEDTDLINAALKDTLDLLDVQLTPDRLRAMIPSGDEEALYASIRSAFSNVWSRGVIDAEGGNRLIDRLEPDERIMVEVDGDPPLEQRVKADLLTPQAALERVIDQLQQSESGAWADKEMAALLAPWARPNLRFDPVRTEDLRRKAAEQVEPVAMRMRTGATLVRVGERATPQIVEMLDEHDAILRQLATPYDRVRKWVGHAVLLAAAILIFTAILQIMHSKTLYQPRHLWVLALISLMALLISRGLLHVSSTLRWLPPSMAGALLPLSLGPILVTVLVNAPAAVALGFWVGLSASIMHGARFPILMMSMAVTVVSVLTARDVQKRSSLFKVGLWVGLTQMAFMIDIGILNQQTLDTVLWQGVAGLVSGMIYSLLALLLIPAFESLFGLTSDIRLLELSDMGHPLLQRMAIEAPGTYHHSLMVANLAQAGAAEIGANALLVRVCAYYHDIGKLSKPDFFTENIQQHENPHNTLSPNMSTLVILSHVKEGVSMALRHKLPSPVIDAIQQHHGTGLISYFYHRARKQGEDTQNGEGDVQPVREEDFRYGGPRPHSKEMAILSLADSIEAASRSIEKPTPGKVEALVNDIVNSKLQDGQLAHSELTFSELTALKRAFAFTLTNMLHGRVAYPQDEDKHQQSAEESEDRPEDSPESEPRVVEPDGAADENASVMG